MTSSPARPSSAAEHAPPQSGSSSLVSDSLIMAVGTALSRVLGFARIAVLAFVLGNNTRQADLFTFAQALPNQIYFLFAGGILNTVLVPQIVRAIKNDGDRGQAYVNRIMTIFLGGLLIVTGVAVLATPLLMRLVVSEQWATDPALAPYWQGLMFMGYLIMPELFFFGMFLILGNVLNASGRFGPMMWAPVLNNVVMLIGLGVYIALFGKGDGLAPFTLGQQLVLAGSVTAGVVVQALVMVPHFRRAGYRFRPRFDFRGVGLGRTFDAAKWTLGYMAVSQIGLIVTQHLASTATLGGTGAGATAYQNARLVWMVPHSIVTVSLATAMLPSATRLATSGDYDGVRREMVRTARLAATVLLPAAVALAALAFPVSRVIVGHGAGSSGVSAVAWTLIAFTLGMVPFTLQYVCLRTFYALEDTRTPFLQQIAIVAVNVVLAIVLVTLVRDPGVIAPVLALAFSASYVVGVVLSWWSLQRRLPGLTSEAIVRHLVRVFCAVAPAGIVAWGLSTLAARLSTGTLATVLSLAVIGVVATAIFVVLARLLHVTEVGSMVDALAGRLPGPAGRLLARWGSPATTPVPGPAESVAAATERPRTPPSPPSTPSPPPGAPAWTDDPVTTTLPALREEPAPGLGRTGETLGGRYRLDQLTGRRGAVESWRAHDESLHRDVAVHLLVGDDRRTPMAVEAARRAAVATDARFLRVLDVVAPVGERAWIVTEYSAGQPLGAVLRRGALTALEAAWVVAEIADAMAQVHAAGLAHRHLHPDTIHLTASGNVKIGGLLIEDALAGRAPDSQPFEHGRRRDVLDLGRLLHAGAVAQWPLQEAGEPRHGLPPAPLRGDGWALPRSVRPSVSPALNRVVERLVRQHPRSGEPLTDARAVARTLRELLGPADASGPLTARVAELARPSVALPMESSAVWETGLLPRVAAAEETSELRAISLTPQSGGSAPDPLAAVPPPTPRAAGATSRPLEASVRRRRRLWPLAAVIVAVGIVFALLLAWFLQPPPRVDIDRPETAAVVSVRSATATGLDGGRAANPDDADLAVDGRPDTAWRTLRRSTASAGDALVLDLGQETEVSRVTVTLWAPSGGGTTAVALRVPQDPATRSAPKARTNWRSVAESPRASGTVTLTTAPVRTRWLRLELTDLPRDGSTRRGGVAEVRVEG